MTSAERSEAILRESLPDHDRIKEYLESRGLCGYIPQERLFFHPSLPYIHDGRLIDRLPAMVAPVLRPNGTMVALQRTYLDPDGPGKAAVPKAKKLTRVDPPGGTRGAAIRLAEARPTLAITEGIETGLAVLEATQTAAWCAVSAWGMANIELPDTVTRVELWADNDQSETGLKAAKKAAARFVAEGREVHLMLPPQVGQDWLDVLVESGHDALRQAQAESVAWRPEARSPSVGIRLCDVEPERVEWLWQGRIPLGKLTVLDGDPGVNKSTLSLDLAARVSTGSLMPDGTDGVQGGVVILSAEDGLGDTILPRLLSAGADLERILALQFVPTDDPDSPCPPSLPEDIPYIRQAVEEVGARLVIIDPLMAYLGPGVNSHKDQDIRRVLFALAAMAEATGAAVLVIRHLTKMPGGDPMYRGGGSIGIIGAARSGFMIGFDPEDGNLRVLASIKNNLARAPKSLAFRVEPTDLGSLRIWWQGESQRSAKDLLDGAKKKDDEAASALEEAKRVMLQILQDGPVAATDAKAQCKQAGVAERTIERAKHDLQVRSVRQPDGSWVWWPHNHQSSLFDDAPGDVGGLGGLGDVGDGAGTPSGNLPSQHQQPGQAAKDADGSVANADWIDF